MSPNTNRMLGLDTNDPVRINAIRIRNFHWTRQTVKAATLLAENRLTQKQIAAEVGCSPRAVANWLTVPVFKSHVSKLVEETRKILAQRYIAQQDQRIASYIQDFERTDQIIQERAEALKDVPGGKSGLIARDFKAVKDEVVEVYEFDAALVRERRAIRKDVAEELGQLTQKHDFKFSGDPRELSPEQLAAMENHMIELACHGDQVKMEQFRRELEGPVIDGTAEVVDDGKSNVPTD